MLQRLGILSECNERVRGKACVFAEVQDGFTTKDTKRSMALLICDSNNPGPSFWLLASTAGIRGELESLVSDHVSCMVQFSSEEETCLPSRKKQRQTPSFRLPRRLVSDHVSCMVQFSSEEETCLPSRKKQRQTPSFRVSPLPPARELAKI